MYHNNNNYYCVHSSWMRNGEALRVNPAWYVGNKKLQVYMNSEWMSCHQVRMLCKLHRHRHVATMVCIID